MKSYLTGVFMVLMGLAVLKAGNLAGVIFVGFGVYLIGQAPLPKRKD